MQDNKRLYDEEFVEEEGTVKKARIDAPSRVVHVRGIPNSTTQAELMELGSPFGKVVNALIMNGKRQALLEFENIDQASALVEHYEFNPATIQDSTVYFQFSRRDSIPSSGKVLLANIKNCQYPITVDVMYHIFARFGEVLKIIIFEKNNQVSSLIQYRDKDSAVSAKAALEGQNIYNNCCTLFLQFSPLKDLNVKYNNLRSRDFTNPFLPTGNNPLGGVPNMKEEDVSLANQNLSFLQSVSMMSPFVGQVANVGVGSTVLMVGHLPDDVTPDELFILFGAYADVARVKILFNKQDTALIQCTNQEQCQTAIDNLNGCPFRGKSLSVRFSKHSFVSPPSSNEPKDRPFTKDFANSPLHRFRVPGSKNFQHISPPSKNIHVSNIPPNTSEDTLRDLFSEYGEVRTFRFFPRNNKMAIVEMDSIPNAVEALIALHDYQVLDDSPNRLRCTFTNRRADSLND